MLAENCSKSNYSMTTYFRICDTVLLLPYQLSQSCAIFKLALALEMSLLCVHPQASYAFSFFTHLAFH